MDNYHDIDDLISKKLSKSLNDKEQVAFDKWLGSSPVNQEEFEYLSKIWNEKSREPKLINSVVKANNIWSQAKSGSKTSFKWGGRMNYFRYFKIAAMIIAVLGISYMVYQSDQSVIQPKVESMKTKIARRSSPSGTKTRVVLPDSSIVWLNSDSYIEFPKNFSNEERTIDLVGEAFFEVKKDCKKPFTVRSFGAHTTALGTSFNISAFPENRVVEVLLVSGKVLVNNVLLRPGEGVSYDKKREFIKLLELDQDEVLGWKNGILFFDGDDFGSFVRKIERWYGVEVSVNKRPGKEWSVKGRFKKEYLTNVLQTVGFNKSFTYELKDKKLKIIF